MPGASKTTAILAYHKVGRPPGDWETWFYIPEPTFVDQLRSLRELGWHVVDAATFLRGLEHLNALPDRSALITFDDGCRQFLDVALPWLRRFGFSAVQFVPTDYIGRTNSFDEGAEPEEPILSWTDLRNLQRWGVSVQSHSLSHRAFSQISCSEREQEVQRSKLVLEQALNRPVEMFAYPKGDEGPMPGLLADALSRAGYKAACLYGGGPMRLPIPDRYRLHRLAMGPDTSLEIELTRGTG